MRLFLQSAMLGLGAYLVLHNEMTAGAMIAGSIMLGRALAPVELAVGQWALIHKAALAQTRRKADGRANHRHSPGRGAGHPAHAVV